MGEVIRPDCWQLDSEALAMMEQKRDRSAGIIREREYRRARGWTKDKIPACMPQPDDEPYPWDDGGTAA